MRLLKVSILGMLFCLSALVWFSYCGVCQAAKPVTKQVIDEKTVFPNALKAIESNKLFSTYLMMLKKVKMLKTLEQPGSHTVIVPTNIAFATLPKPIFINLVTKNSYLKPALQYLILKANLNRPVSLLGKPLHISYHQLTVNGITPIGVMHAKNATLIITNQFVLLKNKILTEN